MSEVRTIILASASKGRKKLLEQIGLRFVVEPSDYEEDMSLAVSPMELVAILAQGKARAVALKHDDAVIIGADSIGVINGEVFGKSRDADGAKKKLKELSGKKHTFITGFTVIDTRSGKEITRAEKTNVYLRKLTDVEIDDYVATGEHVGHAGSYTIQKKGTMFVNKIEGDYTNVIGLPLTSLCIVLKEFGVNVLAQEKAQA